MVLINANIKRILGMVGIFALALLITGPIIALLLSSLREIMNGNIELLELLVPTGRRFALFASSISLSLLTAICTAVLGIIIASVLWQTDKRIRNIFKWFLLISATIPSYVHVIAWTSFFKLFDFISFRGWFASIWVGTMALLPIGIGLVLISFESVENDLWEAGRVILKDTKCFIKILFPSALPAILAGTNLIFLLSLMNYSIPSLFGINVYALEIFAEYSATNEPERAFMLSIPLLILAFLALYFSQNGLRKITLNGFNKRKNIYPKVKWPTFMKIIQAIGFLIFLSSFFLIIISLIIGTKSIDSFYLAVSSSIDEIMYSLTISIIAAIIALIIAAITAKKMMEIKKHKKKWWLLVTSSVAIPAPLIGIGLIAIWNNGILASIYSTSIMPILAVLSRFITFAIIIMIVQYKMIDKSMLEAARVIQKNPFRTLVSIKLPLLAPGLVISYAIVFIFALGELGATLIVTPPGYNTLTVKIYNYMHYGESSAVAGLCLAMIIFVLVMGLIIPAIIKIIKVLPKLFSICPMTNRH